VTAAFLKSFFNKPSLYPCPNEKWLWMCIHKNATTSMREALKGRFYNFPKNDGPQAMLWWQGVTDKELEKYKKWTFVRNPYDRFVSIAYMFNVNPNEFAERFALYTLNSKIRYHSHPQYTYTHIKDECWLDFVGRIETLEEDWKQLGLGEELRHLNTTKHKHYRKELGYDARCFVESYYKKDLEYFDYQW